MKDTFALRFRLLGCAVLGCALASEGQTPIDTRPALMSIVTNAAVKTNMVIMTNYVVVTNFTYKTNLYNAQGQFLQTLPPPSIPGLMPIPGAIPGATPATVATPIAATPILPDPTVVKAAQSQAVRDLFSAGVAAASNKLCVAGSFTNDAAISLQIPDGLTVFDRKKGQALLAAMNTAAEKAAPEALAVFQQAVNQFKPENPAQLLQGSPNAATAHFSSLESQNLSQQIQPLVQRAGVAAGVDQAYQGVMLKGGGLFGAVLGTSKDVDINAHITRGLTQAIWKTLGGQESLIRTDPAARKTKALQDAFKN